MQLPRQPGRWLSGYRLPRTEGCCNHVMGLEFYAVEIIAAIRRC
jgi:hypothetical protein